MSRSLTSRRRPLLVLGGVIVLALLGLVGRSPASATPGALPTPLPTGAHRPAATLPDGFRDSVVLAGLQGPTDYAFSPDGRLFVAEKAGVVRVFPSFDAVTPTVFLSITDRVNSYGDRGLMGLA